MVTFFIILITIVSSYNTFKDELFPIRFGNEQADARSPVITTVKLKAEAIALYPRGFRFKAEDNYNLFMEHADKALATVYSHEPTTVAFLDLDRKPQTPYEVIRNYKWNKQELFAVMEYCGSTTAARNIRKYFQTTDPAIKVPIFANLIHSATHKPQRKTDFFVPGFISYFGMKGIDIPIKLDEIDKYIGDTLEGATLYGPWSSSKDINVAESKFFAPCKTLYDKTGDVHFWTDDPKKRWIKQEATVIFKVEVPAADSSTDIDELGVAPVEDISAHSKEKELLLYDVPGRYVTIHKVCYSEVQSDEHWADERADAKERVEEGRRRAEKEKHKLKEVEDTWGLLHADNSVRDALGYRCIVEDFRRGATWICPAKITFNGIDKTYACQDSAEGVCECNGNQIAHIWLHELTVPQLKDVTAIIIQFPEGTTGFKPALKCFTEVEEYKYRVKNDVLEQKKAEAAADSAEQIDENMYNLWEENDSIEYQRKKEEKSYSGVVTKRLAARSRRNDAGNGLFDRDDMFWVTVMNGLAFLIITTCAWLILGCFAGYAFAELQHKEIYEFGEKEKQSLI